RMKHIVLCGDLTPNRIEQFFNEIFHEDHDLVDTRVAVMSDEDPSSDLVAMLLDPFVAKRTTFLKGSILHDYDAARASCATASAIFVLTRKVGQEDVNLSDHRTFMRAMAAHRVAKDVPIYAQLHLSSNKHLFHDIEQNNVLCFSEVIHSILAQNCLCPGFSTFIYNLTTTAGCETELDDTWESRYLHGASHELYSVQLPPPHVIEGLTFAEVSAWVYSRCNGVILFAIHVLSADGHGTIVLNPGSTYWCRGNEIGFVIAKDRKTADNVTSMAKETTPKQPGVSSHSMLKADSLHDLAIIADVPKKKGTSSATTPGGGGPHALRKKRNSRMLMWSAKESKPAGQIHKRTLKECVVFDVTKLKLSSSPIVVCLLAPTFPDHMEYFVVPLRSPVIKEHHPIVFLTHKLPTRESYEPLSCYSDLYFVETTKICLESLKRGGVEIARRIVLMCGGGEFAETSSAELLADASSIATHKSITSLLGPARAPSVITELVNRANVHFISHNIGSTPWFTADDDPNSELSLVDAGSFSRSRAFASGLTYSTSLCDSLMINQFFNPMIKNIVREFVFSALRAHTAVFPNVSSPVKAGAPARMAVQRSALFTCEMPMDFVGKTFGYVFDHLLASDAILTLGIYRCVDHTALAEASTPLAPMSPTGMEEVTPPPEPFEEGALTPLINPTSRIEIPEQHRPTCSGIPGMILALGGCGTPELSVVGPRGTHAFVSSTKSFARRNYPVITCSEVESDGRTGQSPSPPPSHISHTSAASNDPVVDDRYVRITPVSARRTQGLPRHGTPSSTCRHCKQQPVEPPAKKSESVVVSRPALVHDQPMLQWLQSYYQDKDPSKVPYIQVILNKYQGRHDDLKHMLVAKYGPLAAPDEASDDEPEAVQTSPRKDERTSSNSDDTVVVSDVSTNARQAEPNDDSQDVVLASTASSSDDEDDTNSMETWLRTFYTRHNPSMLPRLHSILQMYAGREDQLKAMLDQKYVASTKRPLEQNTQDNGAKKFKGASIDSVTDVFLTPPSTPRPSPIQYDQVICYVVEYVHTSLPLARVMSDNLRFKTSSDSTTIAWVVDVPDMTWLPHVTALLTSCQDHHPALVVHLTPSSVALHPTYIYISGHTRHLLFDGQLLDEFRDGACAFNFEASARLRLQLHAKSAALFPLSSPFQAIATATPTSAASRLMLRSSAGTTFHVAQPGLTCQLTAMKSNQQIGFHYRACTLRLAPEVSAPSSVGPAGPPSHAPKLTFLGTGCAAPSKLRNSSAIYLDYSPPSTHGILIDCGEGTFGQLWRQFGPATSARLRTLQCIWVSHKHADHHCGLLRVLLERHRAFVRNAQPATSLVVIAPDAVLAYVARWRAAWLHGVHMVTCVDFNHPQHPLRSMVLGLTGFQNLWSVPVHHCHDSFGLVLITHTGMKVVYSGDTRPCDRLVHEGFRPHVLIHEATFEDSMYEDAVKKNHSTVGEALEVGHRMQAQLVLLTHFSQRYPKLPPRQATASGSPCGFAFDGMQVTLDALPQRQHDRYMPPLPMAHAPMSTEATLAMFMTAMRKDDVLTTSSPPPSP
ncbi:hypothetical protein DYB36_005129, partial [Aphanomyces astaci]